MTGGSYLAFFFMISHNFEGAQALTDTTRPSNKGGEKNSFLYKQVPLIIKWTLFNHLALTCICDTFKIVPSSNVGGWFLCNLHGGLNYQIEHHLFPRMNHCHYPTIAPIVRYEQFQQLSFQSHPPMLNTYLDNSVRKRTFPTDTFLPSGTIGRALWHTSLIWVTIQTLPWGWRWPRTPYSIWKSTAIHIILNVQRLMIFYS